MNESDEGGNSRILIVDDNPKIHDDFRKILTQQENISQELDQIESELFGSEHIEIVLKLNSLYETLKNSAQEPENEKIIKCINKIREEKDIDTVLTEIPQLIKISKNKIDEILNVDDG